jgi:hypothetical protein
MYSAMLEASLEQRAVAAEMEATRQRIEAITRSLRNTTHTEGD